MAVESAADLAGFFDDEEHAVAASYTPSGGSAAAVTVIFESGREAVETGMGVVNQEYRRARIQESEVALPAAGDTVAIGGTTYTVQGAELADGVWTVGLR